MQRKKLSGEELFGLIKNVIESIAEEEEENPFHETDVTLGSFEGYSASKDNILGGFIELNVDGIPLTIFAQHAMRKSKHYDVCKKSGVQAWIGKWEDHEIVNHVEFVEIQAKKPSGEEWDAAIHEVIALILARIPCNNLSV